MVPDPWAALTGKDRTKWQKMVVSAHSNNNITLELFCRICTTSMITRNPC